MKVNVVSRKFIKPCKPTPQNLKIYKLSFTDELSPSMNISAIILYSSHSHFNSNNIKIKMLEESLSKILPQFYPLAGRYINKDRFVDCNDEGAEFVQAQVVDDIHDVVLLDKIINDVLPRQSYEANQVNDPLLSIQLTTFKCGGVVISVSVSHKIFDASSIATFISAWVNANRSIGINIITPNFDSPTMFPFMNFPHDDLDAEPSRSPDPTIVVKRFLFNKEAITSLRSRIQGGGRGSRVRLVCALIAKALIGIDRTVQGRSRPCLVAQAINIRDRTSIPTLSKHCCGNLVAQAMATISKEENVEFEDLVDVIGDAIDKTITGCGAISSLSSSEGGKRVLIDPLINAYEKIGSGEMNVMWFSDWSKFRFYEEADFGWGKPVWTGVGTMPAEKLTVLMGNKEGDGIEAFVHLNHTYMPYFEQDEDIKLFTTCIE